MEEVITEGRVRRRKRKYQGKKEKGVEGHQKELCEACERGIKHVKEREQDNRSEFTMEAVENTGEEWSFMQQG